MDKNITKDEWVDLLKDIGLTDEMMNKWHTLFEKRHPEAHQSFLCWLGLSEEEIASIRKS